MPLDAKICVRQVCGGTDFRLIGRFPVHFSCVAFSGSERTSATLEIVQGFVAMAGIAGWSNGWLAGLGLQAFDLVSWDLSV